MKYTTHSAEETKALAAELARTLTGGEFVALVGDLGAGKTTFAQGFVSALGSSSRVKSPTFTVMNEYKIDRQGGVSNPAISRIARIVHLDFYRFSDEKELGALELENEKRPDTVILAEWPNIFAKDVFKPDVTVTFKHAEGDTREIEVL
ncbi:MAG: tRNA (adenosine(37)-N6)-threonylcarbamoyltransferase complex ATPase subunit type 1 TsaE [Patescibacteria group bacterium]|jgi:tRNA threonylcarbamoyladenosine biosynthesis protein TsaE